MAPKRKGSTAIGKPKEKPETAAATRKAAAGKKTEEEAAPGAAKEVEEEAAPAAEEAAAAAPEPAAEAEVPRTKKGKTGLAVGDFLPEDLPTLETDESTDEAKKTVLLGDLVKTNGVVIFFYPKANTGGCTKQACGFRDNFSQFADAGYTVLGMSADKPKSQASWKKKYDLKYNLLSDPSLQVLKKLGVARGTKGINRSHIVIEKGGKVKDIRVGISPGDSVSEALKTVTGK